MAVIVFHTTTATFEELDDKKITGTWPTAVAAAVTLIDKTIYHLFGLELPALNDQWAFDIGKHAV